MDELNNFITYIPYNCSLDICVCSSNNKSKKIKEIIKNNGDVQYVICDFASNDVLDITERMDLLYKAYNMYVKDYSEPINFSIITTYSIKNEEKLNKKSEKIKNDFDGLVIKKIKYKNEKISYKSGKNANTLKIIF